MRWFLWVIRRTGVTSSPLFAITASTGAVVAIGAVAGVGAARLLGPSGRGDLAGAFVWAGLLTSIVGLGFDQSVVFVANTPRHKRRVLTTALAAAPLQALVGSALCFGLAALLFPESGIGETLRAYALVWVPATLVQTAIISILQGQQRWREFNLSRIVLALSSVSAILAIALLRRAPDAADVALAQGVSVACLAVVLIWITRRDLRSFPSLSTFGKLVSYGLRALPGLGFYAVALRLDQAVLSLIAPAALLGKYVVAGAVSAAVVPVASSIGMAAFPALASLRHVGTDYRGAVSKILRRAILILGALSVPVAIVGPFLIVPVFGSAYAGARVASAVLAIAAFPLGLMIVIADVLRGLGRPGAASLGQLVGALVTVPAVLILVPAFGIEGAAVASLVAYSCSAVALAWFLWRALEGETPHRGTPGGRVGEERDLA